MLRSLAERLSRGKVIKRRLPHEFSKRPLYVTPDAALRYLKPSKTEAFDGELLAVAKQELSEDSIVWDVGANVGVFTFAAASIASKGSVLAIEPDIWLAALLRRSAALRENARLDIRVLPAAVSGDNGVAAFLIAQRGRASNSLDLSGGLSQMGGVRERVFVPTLTLDTLLECLPKPDFIKIDVEGAEIDVLSGGTKMLTEVRPTVYIEVSNDSCAAATKLFHDYDFALFMLAKYGKKSIPIDSCRFNTLAVPRENITD